MAVTNSLAAVLTTLGGVEKVSLFIPNIIGYVRIVLAILSCSLMLTHYAAAAWCYSLSHILDEVDGRAARMFNQVSKFGALLDMLTDRCATSSLSMVLCIFYPQYTLLFQLQLWLDIFSHWLHVSSMTLRGENNHKQTAAYDSHIMKLYYTSNHFLSFMCSGNEFFYISLYLLHFTSGYTVFLGPWSCGMWALVSVLCAPVAVGKACINLVQLQTACQGILAHDSTELQLRRTQSRKGM